MISWNDLGTHNVEGTLPTATAPSYRLTRKRNRWRILWMQADQDIGNYADLDAAEAVAQAHANDWKAFGILWHDREHYGPDATENFVMEAFHYFQAGLQQGRRESL